MPSPLSFLLSLLLLLSPLALAQIDPNADYSWPMVGANLQRNGQANPKTTMLTNPNMSWAFLDPNGQELQFAPIYDYVNDVVWTVSGDGFVYQVNATTGNMTYEICVGKQPAFPGDPCGNVNFDDRTMGQLTLLTSRDVILMYQQDTDAPDVMVRISREEGNVVWALELYNDTVDPSGNSHFMSLPTVINGINPANKSADVILVWVLNINSTDDSLRATYTMIDADTGAVMLERPWLTPQQVLFPPPTVDPEDGNVISQFTNDVQPQCGEDYEQFYLCTGIGKFETLTGEHIWNNTMGQSFSNGLVSIFNGIVQVSTTQLDAYSYFTKNGQGRWQIPETTSTYDQFWPAVCPDGTVIFPDNGQYIQGWGPQVVRPKKDKFWVGCNGPCALVPAVTMDGNFYMMEGNSLVSHSCKDGSVNWSRDFGDTDAETWPVAIGYEAVYINAYKPGTGGALVKMVDTGASDFKQYEMAW